MRIIVNNVISKLMYRDGVPMWECGWKEPLEFDKPFYIEDVSGSANTLSIVKNASGSPTLSIEYSTDLNTWSSLGSTSETPLTLSIPANSKVYLRCECNAWNQNKISCSGNHNVGGNITSLIFGSNFNGQTEITGNTGNKFTNLFVSDTHIVDASRLILPSAGIKSYDYQGAFEGCTGLTKAPYMPAISVGTGGYQKMFKGCTSLVKAPNIAPTDVGEWCLKEMFSGCTALTKSPDVLPATTMRNNSYESMFYNCSSLTKAPNIAATNGTWQGCRSMFEGCTSLMNPPTMYVDTITYECFENMFKGCTSLISAPTLTITSGSGAAFMRSMFEGCTSLVDASHFVVNMSEWTYYEGVGAFKNCSALTNPPTINVDTLGTNSAVSMFEGCTSLTSMTIPATTFSGSGCSSMFKGCTNLAEVICYATSGFDQCNNWLQNVAANGTFKKPAAATGWSEGASGIPTGWTVVDL